MRITTSTICKTFFAGCIITAMVACNSNPTKSTTTIKDSSITQNTIVTLKPTTPAPVWGPSIKPEMQVVVDKLISLGGKPIETLDAKEARKQPTPTDAVMAVMKDNNMTMPAAQCDTMGKDIPVTGGTTHIRIYTPKAGKAPYPVIVYYHGGGFVIANIDVYNGGAQGMCEQVGAILVSVEYPKGPEHKFPAAHTVSFDAYQWVLKNAASFNGDATKLALVGESAGGNLAANMSMMARDKKIQMPLYEVLVYPMSSNDVNSESYVKYAAAKPLNKPMMEWFYKNYAGSVAHAADPRLSIVKANLTGMPKTLIIAAEIDPLQSEGKMLSEKLNAAGVQTDYKLYTGVTHEFFGMAAVVPEAKEAQALAASKLKAALGL